MNSYAILLKSGADAHFVSDSFEIKEGGAFFYKHGDGALAGEQIGYIADVAKVTLVGEATKPDTTADMFDSMNTLGKPAAKPPSTFPGAADPASSCTCS